MVPVLCQGSYPTVASKGPKAQDISRQLPQPSSLRVYSGEGQAQGKGLFQGHRTERRHLGPRTSSWLRAAAVSIITVLLKVCDLTQSLGSWKREAWFARLDWLASD